jgi:hypothetical protein
VARTCSYPVPQNCGTAVAAVALSMQQLFSSSNKCLMPSVATLVVLPSLPDRCKPCIGWVHTQGAHVGRSFSHVRRHVHSYTAAMAQCPRFVCSRIEAKVHVAHRTDGAKPCVVAFNPFIYMLRRDSAACAALCVLCSSSVAVTVRKTGFLLLVKCGACLPIAAGRRGQTTRGRFQSFIIHVGKGFRSLRGPVHALQVVAGWHRENGMNLRAAQYWCMSPDRTSQTEPNQAWSVAIDAYTCWQGIPLLLAGVASVCTAAQPCKHQQVR